MPERDEVEPGESWEFDEEVAQVFDDMLERSIPQYGVMRDLVTDLALHYIRLHGGGSTVIDLGASRGEAIARLKEKTDDDRKLGIKPSFQAIEISESMLATLEERWPQKDSLHRHPFRRQPHGVYIHRADLREGLPRTPEAVVTLCVLTLQFVPIEYRQRILREVWKRTRPGGALILVEKVLGSSADVDQLFVDTYYSLKGSNGYSKDQIERKRLSLEGVLVPVTAAWNEELLRMAGFREVDCIWRWANFAGWLAVKES